MVDIRTAESIGMPYLYRYQPFHLERLRKVIVEGTLYFSKPSDFNDPWDCRPCYHLDLGDEAAVQAHVAYFERVDRQHNGHLGEEALAARAKRLREDRAFLRDVVRLHVDMFEAIDKRFRVFCLAGSPMQPLMWAHYGKSHTGVCFQFANDGFFGVAHQVIYRAQYPLLSLTATGVDLIEPLLTKSSDWGYEEEYRLIAQERSQATKGQTIMTDDHMTSFPLESLRAIYLGSRMSEANRQAVVELVRQAGLRIEVRQVHIQPDRYALLDRPVEI